MQQDIVWADHLVLFYPLWLGTLPALFKGFLEQVFRPGFALADPDKPGRMPKKLLKGRTARIVVTMGMPAFVYRWYFHAHSLKSLERNVLGMSGIGPIKSSIIGTIGGDPAKRQEWLAKMEALGRAGE